MAKLSKRISRAMDVLRGRRAAYAPNEILQATQQALKVNKHFMNGYDAAKTGRTRADWGTSTDTPYYELDTAHKKIRARSRELYKNDSTYRAAINAIVNHVVGRGLRPKPMVVNANGDPVLGINKQLETLADRYLATKAWDAGKRMSFIGEGQALALKTQIRDGDILFNKVRSRRGGYLSTAWQMAEVDRLDDSKDLFWRTFEFSENVKQTVHGIGLDDYGAPVEYWFRGVEKPVDAANIIHSYYKERPEQYIGEPLGAAILDVVYDKHDLSEDYIQKSRAIAKVLWQMSTYADSFPYAGDKDSDGFVELESMSQMRTDEAPNMIKMPDDISKTMEPLMKMVKHDICSGMGLSYITVLLDMEKVSFAAASMISVKEWITLHSLRDLFIHSCCQPIWEQTVLQAVLDGKITGLNINTFLDDPYKYTRCVWNADAREYADPLKTTRAAIENIQSGRTSLQEDLAARGKNYNEHIQEIVQAANDMKEAGIDLYGTSGGEESDEEDTEEDTENTGGNEDEE